MESHHQNRNDERAQHVSQADVEGEEDINNTNEKHSKAAFSAATLLTSVLATAVRAGTVGVAVPHEGVKRTIYAPPGVRGYGFEYSVVDSTASWMHSRGEWSDGVSTHGSYNVRLPDGRVQRVSYTADEHGFRPVITYEEPHGHPGGFGWKVGGGDGYAKEALEVDGRSPKEENGLGGRPHPGKDTMDLEVEGRSSGEGHVMDVHPREVYPSHGHAGREHPRSDFVPLSYQKSYEPYPTYHEPSYFGSEPHLSYPARTYEAKVTHHGSPRDFPQQHDSPHYYHAVHDDAHRHVMHATLKPRTYHINKSHKGANLLATHGKPPLETRKPTNGHSMSHKLMSKEEKMSSGEMLAMHDNPAARDMREEGHAAAPQTTLAPSDPIYRQDYSPMFDHRKEGSEEEEGSEGNGEESEEEEEEEEEEKKKTEDDGTDEDKNALTSDSPVVHFVPPTYLRNALTPTPAYRRPSPTPQTAHPPYPHSQPHYPTPHAPHHPHMYHSHHPHYQPSAPSPHHLTHAVNPGSPPYPYPYLPPHNPHTYPLPIGIRASRL
ncbi:uncharacterized protein LOC122258982 [Penaeus japonicus]|uniref:uncharacterized protein LOC122258982 n=1 Tax=Penaeus japonicus TaxID=27405 RepID=UPI001C710B48|nr:uncharacterized protein LOC122258982 [Penaeus japonicus]